MRLTPTSEWIFHIIIVAMDNLSSIQFERLVEGARVLTQGRRGPCVYLTPAGKVVKLFRQKGWWSSNRLYPYARRFARNAERLRELGFTSVNVERLAECRDLKAHLVVYPLLPGETIRELAARAEDQQRALAGLPAYLSALHHSGVYYKALHLGQVLARADGSFALIDIHSTRFFPRPLSVNDRVANLLHILDYAQDRAALTRYGLVRFFSEYLSCCQLGERRKAALVRKLGKTISLPQSDAFGE